MSFFNSKEEILDIELTQYGKLLLSRGLFKPQYYSFHDDDVLYDSDYANVSENTNNAEVRIQDETTVHKPFYSFKSSTPNIDYDFKQEQFKNDRAFLSLKTPNLVNLSLSNSTISNNYIPAWEIYNLSSNFTSSTSTYTNVNVVSASIPQFEINIPITFYKTNQDQIDDNPSLQALSLIEQITQNDSDILIYVDKPLVVKILENNNDFDYDAFDMEIFKVSKDKDNNDVFEPLKFVKQQNNYNSELDLFVSTNDSLQQLENIDSSFADFYFDVLVDKEMNNKNICRYVLRSNQDQDNIFDDITICDELRTQFNTENLYDNLPDIATGKNC